MSSKTNIIISIVCFSLTIGLCFFLIVHKNGKELTDAIKFKKQFEAVSELENPYTGNKYINITIDENNPFIYKTAKEVYEIMKNESAIIFMGYPESDLTRTILPIFIDVLKEYSISKVYYLDIFDIRDEYKFSGSIMPELVKEGTNSYHQIVTLLDNYLDKYYVNDEVGNRYDTLVKRINTPTFITVKDGKIIDYHYGAVINHDEEHFELNELEHDKLKEIFEDMISKYKEANEVCTEKSAC